METEAWPLSVIVYIYVGGYDISALVCSALAFGLDPDLLIPKHGEEDLNKMRLWYIYIYIYPPPLSLP